MLGSKTSASGATTLVSRDTTVTGSIEFTGSLEVEGLVKGNINAGDGKEAVVRILARGQVDGEIRAPTVVIDGSVKGDVYATRQLQLASKARVEGNVFYAQAEMNIGAEVNGTFQHIGDKPAAPAPGDSAAGGAARPEVSPGKATPMAVKQARGSGRGPASRSNRVQGKS